MRWLASKLEKETADRLKQNIDRLGEKGLAELERKLDEAQKENDKDIPPEMISNFKIPDVGSIRWLSVESAAAGNNPTRYDNDAQKRLDQDKAELPYFLQFERTYHLVYQFLHRCSTKSP
ncbi:hypothetical protein EMMF5_002188 [Cystobasidiomycetes sp. EMM_F5]